MAEGFWDWTDIARLVVTPGPTACRPTDGQRRGIAFHLLLAPGAFGKFWPATLLSRPPGATSTAASVLFPPGPVHSRRTTVRVALPRQTVLPTGTGRTVYPPAVPPTWSVRPCPGMNEGTSADVSGAGDGLGT